MLQTHAGSQTEFLSAQMMTWHGSRHTVAAARDGVHRPVVRISEGPPLLCGVRYTGGAAPLGHHDLALRHAHLLAFVAELYTLYTLRHLPQLDSLVCATETWSGLSVARALHRATATALRLSYFSRLRG